MGRWPSASILDIRDDGVGMALSDMQEQFLAVGGSRKFNDPQTIGRIGIGFLAIVPFCERITIYTKARDETMAIRADIDTNTMLPQGVRFDEIATKQIGSATTLSADDTRRLVAQYGESFTVFTLTNLRADVANTFSEPDDFTAFKEELRTILPLPWPKTGPLQNMISEQLWSLLTKRASQHHTTVYLNDPKSPLTRRIYGENTTAENALYVQEFIEQIILAPDASVGQSVPIRIIGFFVCDEPTNEPRKGRKLTGVITRVLNVAVDEDTFFGLEGKEERKKRVAGELFIEGLDANQAIQINRNAFTETHKPVQLFREEMRHQLTTFLSGMNRIWRARSVINKEVRRIRDLVSGVGDALTAINASPEGLKPQGKSRRPPALMKHPLRRHFSIRPSRGVPPY